LPSSGQRSHGAGGHVLDGSRRAGNARCSQHLRERVVGRLPAIPHRPKAGEAIPSPRLSGAESRYGGIAEERLRPIELDVRLWTETPMLLGQAYCLVALARWYAFSTASRDKGLPSLPAHSELIDMSRRPI